MQLVEHSKGETCEFPAPKTAGPHKVEPAIDLMQACTRSIEIIRYIRLIDDATHIMFTGVTRPSPRKSRKNNAMSTMKSLLAGVVSLASSFAIPAQAGQAQQVQSVDLGGLSGVAYYTAEAAGYRVVVSLARHESSPAVRFEATLAPDQDAVVSIPRELGAQAQSLRIRRIGDTVIVRKIIQETASVD